MTDTTRGRWWSGRRARLFVLLGILVLLLAAIGLDIWIGRRVDAEFARLEQRYGSLDGRSLVAPPVAATDNQARFVRAAIALTLPAAGDPGHRAITASLEKLHDSTEVPDDLRAFADANRAALRMVNEARTRRQSSWDADYAGGGNVPSLLQVRTLSDAIVVAALVDVDAGRIDDAAGRTASGLAVAASFRQEPSLIAQLIRISVALQQCQAVERLIATSEPSKIALEELARSLGETRTPDPMRVGLLAELRYENAALARLERGQGSRGDVSDLLIWGGPLERVGRIGRSLVRLARIDFLREMERLIEIQAGPRPHPPFPGASHIRPWSWRLSSAVTPGLERAIDSGDLFNSVLGVAELGVALRRYRLDRGSYPDELSAVVPAYLSRLPVDPATGRAPVYERVGTGFTLKAQVIRRDAAVNSALEWTVAK